MKFTSIKLAAVATLMLGTTAVFAEGADTNAGTSVPNRATISYTVGGATSTVESSPGGNTALGAGNGADTTFLVDRKVNFTLVERSGTYGDPGAAPVSAVPGATAGQLGTVLGYTLTNLTNGIQDFALTSANGADPHVGDVAGSVTDGFNATAPTIYLDDGDGVFDAGDTIVTYINDLAEGASVVLYIVSNIPAEGAGATGTANLETDGITLTATAADVAGTAGAPGTLLTAANTGGADSAGAVDHVLADDGAGAVGDGTESATDAYIVYTAAINVAKYSRVVSDPFNGTTNPKRIPGAVIEYCIAVKNLGAQQATAVGLSDTLDAALTPVAGTGSGTVADVTTVTDAASCTTAANGAVLGTYTMQTYNANISTVDPNSTRVVRFTATVK